MKTIANQLRKQIQSEIGRMGNRFGPLNSLFSVIEQGSTLPVAVSVSLAPGEKLDPPIELKFPNLITPEHVQFFLIGAGMQSIPKDAPNGFSVSKEKPQDRALWLEPKQPKPWKLAIHNLSQEEKTFILFAIPWPFDFQITKRFEETLAAVQKNTADISSLFSANSIFTTLLETIKNTLASYESSLSLFQKDLQTTQSVVSSHGKNLEEQSRALESTNAKITAHADKISALSVNEGTLEQKIAENKAQIEVLKSEPKPVQVYYYLEVDAKGGENWDKQINVRTDAFPTIPFLPAIYDQKKSFRNDNQMLNLEKGLYEFYLDLNVKSDVFTEAVVRLLNVVTREEIHTFYLPFIEIFDISEVITFKIYLEADMQLFFALDTVAMLSFQDTSLLIKKLF